MDHNSSYISDINDADKDLYDILKDENQDNYMEVEGITNTDNNSDNSIDDILNIISDSENDDEILFSVKNTNDNTQSIDEIVEKILAEDQADKDLNISSKSSPDSSLHELLQSIKNNDLSHDRSSLITEIEQLWNKLTDDWSNSKNQPEVTEKIEQLWKSLRKNDYHFDESILNSILDETDDSEDLSIDQILAGITSENKTDEADDFLSQHGESYYSETNTTKKEEPNSFDVINSDELSIKEILDEPASTTKNHNITEYDENSAHISDDGNLTDQLVEIDLDELQITTNKYTEYSPSKYGTEHLLEENPQYNKNINQPNTQLSQENIKKTDYISTNIIDNKPQNEIISNNKKTQTTSSYATSPSFQNEGISKNKTLTFFILIIFLFAIGLLIWNIENEQENSKTKSESTYPKKTTRHSPDWKNTKSKTNTEFKTSKTSDKPANAKPKIAFKISTKVTTETRREIKPEKDLEIHNLKNDPGKTAPLKTELNPPKNKYKHSIKNKDNKHEWILNLTSVFEEEQTSHDELGRIRDRGIPAEIYSVTHNNKQWYRLRIKGFDNKQSAVRYMEEVKEKTGIKKYWISKSLSTDN